MDGSERTVSCFIMRGYKKDFFQIELNEVKFHGQMCILVKLKDVTHLIKMQNKKM